MTHSEERRSATHRENGDKNQKDIFELQQHWIGIHDIIAACTELHETKLLLQEHQNDPQ